MEISNHYFNQQVPEEIIRKIVNYINYKIQLMKPYTVLSD